MYIYVQPRTSIYNLDFATLTLNHRLDGIEVLLHFLGMITANYIVTPII